MQEIILATSNPGKLKELQSLLTSMHCIPQHELGIKEAEETGLTFLENALIKARHASKLGNKPALADDSGLVVPFLNGAPGIYSARFAGEKASDEGNIELLLNQLQETTETQRYAYYYCAIVMTQHANDPTPLIAVGKWQGSILLQKRGNQGFGYDPIFYVPEQGCTASELSMGIKNTLSHRAQALNQLITQLKNI